MRDKAIKKMSSSSKKIVKNPIKIWVSVLILTLTVTPMAHSEEFDGGGFTLEIPGEFVRRPSTHPQAALVLQSKTQSFPTFNVVSESVPLSDEFEVNKFGEAIVRGYKLVGLTDAALKSAVRLSEERWRGEVLYTQSGERLCSIVEWVNAPPSRHYILTFIDREEVIDRSRFLQAELSRSFKLKTVALPKPKPEPKSTLTKALETSLLMLVIIGLAALLIRQWASRR